MKFKIFTILLFAYLCGPALAQDRPDVSTVLYSQGFILASSGSQMYVQGSVVAASNATTQSTIIVDDSEIIITGHLINNVQSGTVFENPAGATPGTIEFRGTTEQWITTDGITYADIPSKTDNYIDFPNILINNSSHVRITPEIAVHTQNINLATGWLIVDSRNADAAKDYSPSETQNVQNNTVFAHLMVDGSIEYNNWTADNVNERGFIQVNMALENEGITTDNSVNEGRPVTSLVGFGSPFEELRADYFMFNILIQPDHTGFFGTLGIPNRYPDNILTAGRGTIISVDLKGGVFDDNYAEPESQYNTPEAFDQRAKEGFYCFNRHQFSVDPNRQLNQIFGSSPTNAAYLNEKLNNRDFVEIPLQPGYNYLSNPFLTPLDISELLIESPTENSWGVIVSGTSGSMERDIYNGVWILNPDSKAEYKGDKKADFTYTYRLAQNPGGTVEESLIAPLQMFVVWSPKQTAIRIPKSARIMGETKFIRNSRLTDRKDDFIIEIIDEKTYTSDRTNFVLRSASEIASIYNGRDVVRTTSVSSTDGVIKNVSKSLGSQLFTRKSGETSLMVNFLPLETTSSVQLYVKPSYVEQEIMLRGHRLNSMYEINEMWLEDKIQKTIIPFTEETRYRTSMKPTDREDRFVIHFKKPTSFSDSNESVIAYYNNGKIIMEGFLPESFGSDMYLYNISGGLITQIKIDQYRMVIPAILNQGTYLIRIVGNRTYSFKLLVNQL